jgi:hypothetical protein
MLECEERLGLIRLVFAGCVLSACAAPRPKESLASAEPRASVKAPAVVPALAPAPVASVKDPKGETSEHVIGLTRSGITFDGRPVCQATTTLGDGYAPECVENTMASRVLESILRRALEDEQRPPRTFRVDAEMALPLVAFQQAITTFYRASLTTFTLRSESHARAIRNQRDSCMLSLSWHGHDNSIRVGFEQGSITLDPTCARKRAPITDDLNRCLEDAAGRCGTILVDMDALATFRDARTMESLWALLSHIPATVHAALR